MASSSLFYQDNFSYAGPILGATISETGSGAAPAYALFDLSLPLTCDSAAAFGIGSGDYQFIVGQVTTSGVSSGVLWVAGTQNSPLTPLAGGPVNDAAYGCSITAVSVVIVGRSNGKPCVWTNGVTPHELTVPAGFAAGDANAAYCVTPNGTRAGGSVNDGANQFACFWDINTTTGASTITLLPSGGSAPLASAYEAAFAISDDGALAVGGTDNAAHTGAPCRWATAGPTLTLLAVNVGGEAGVARGLTADDSSTPRIVGRTNSLKACVWNGGSGFAVSALPAVASATDSEALGSSHAAAGVFCGWSVVGGVTLPTYWTSSGAVVAQALGLTGGVGTVAGMLNATSPDGTGFAGAGDDARSATAALWWFSGGIIAAEQSRTTVDLSTLPYTVSEPFGVSLAGPPLYLHPATLQYGCAVTNSGAVRVSIDHMTLETLGQSSATQTIYGSGIDTTLETNSNFNFNAYGGRAFVSALNVVGQTSTVYFYNVPLVPGTPGSAITYRTTPEINLGIVIGGAPFSGFGFGSDVICLTAATSSTGVMSASLADGSTESTAAQVATNYGNVNLNLVVNPDMMKPNPSDATTNLFLSRCFGSSLWCAEADNTTGVSAFSNYLNFSASDVNTMLCSNVTNGSHYPTSDVYWTVTPDGWFAYANRVTWEDDQGISPTTNGGVLVKISNDFSKYWVYYLTWKGGDATAQLTLDNTDNSPTIVFSTPPPPPPSNLQASVADLYFNNTGTFEDLGIEVNRRRFISATGGARYLGQDGSGAFGAAPPVFLTVTGGGAPDTADTFARNNGDGGTFVETNGPLTLSVSSPPGSTAAAPAGPNVVGDYRNGQIYVFNLDQPLDAGVQRRWLRSFRATPQPSKQPRRFDCLTIDFETGAQVPQDEPPLGPLIVVRWSDDGGHTWSNERFVRAGPPGATTQRVMVKRMGATRRGQGLDRIYEVSSTDVFKVAIIGADIDP